MISDVAVMSHMGVGHKEIAIPDNGLPPSMDSASMESDELPKDILIADQKGGLLSFIGKMLRGFSNRARIGRYDISSQFESLPE